MVVAVPALGTFICTKDEQGRGSHLCPVQVPRHPSTDAAATFLPLWVGAVGLWDEGIPGTTSSPRTWHVGAEPREVFKRLTTMLYTGNKCKILNINGN